MDVEPDCGGATLGGSGRLDESRPSSPGDAGIGRAVSLAPGGADDVPSYLPEEEDDARLTDGVFRTRDAG